MARIHIFNSYSGNSWTGRVKTLNETGFQNYEISLLKLTQIDFKEFQDSKIIYCLTIFDLNEPIR
jgi:hypothetical protein